MASLVLILSFLLRTKTETQASAVTAASFHSFEDDSSLVARGEQLRKYERMLEMNVEEPKVCIFLI